ncbi:two-component system sensor histidine kinase NtrB [Desulforhabdus amnigena]|uniref:histidine kinase n=1 Tax=Desulforhabdus amnigena TaxID=40218 RepID=A0A9W6L9D2_9BACT|nr:ATP-binding protein [Desulforhabdus amnigena]NLJ29530.1 PAS domain S-box protein [Deltaproteobacteria bacterium]GLI35160.1 hypothetical protein DAMNIGENAA_25930 [Desulforhabdus amnigena]
MVLPLDFRKKLLSETLVWDILESVTDAVITIDEDHKVLLCNKAAEKMFGYKCSEIVGQDVSPLIPNPHQAIHREYVERYIETGTPRVIGKFRECFGLHKEGRSFPVEISYSVSRTEGRLYFTAVIRDISRRKEMERELRFMEKLAAIGKTVAQVVHEIRKPLMLMGGFARQVQNCEGLREDEKNKQKLGIVIEEVRRLEALLNGVRLLTRPPAASQKHSLSVNQVLKETFELLEPMLQDRQVELNTELSPYPLMIQGDADQLKQVILNILQNAVDAMQGVGTISVSTRMAFTMVQIIIKDNGPGIREELQEKIFDPFFTTKTDGTGLGLAISRNIIQDHGGTITLVSAPSKGATFIIELPLDIAP